jgi:membrane-associated protease RseP (regulator of RpoE activity)
MRSHLAVVAALLGLAACTHTLQTSQRYSCPPPRTHAASGIGIIGMSLDHRSTHAGDAELFVDRVVPDGPAAAAGVRPGDRIVTIDGTSTRGMTVGEAARRLRGPTAASVSLQLATDGHARTVQITRVAPSELWSGAAAAPHGQERVRPSDVAPAAPLTAPPCRQLPAAQE